MSFTFNTPSSAPANSGLSSGFSFGANKPATPGFGLTATSQPSGLFGAPATSAPAFGSTSLGSTSFGATAAPAFGTAAPTFGAGTAAPAFGTTPAFGAATSAPTFGTTPASGTLSAAPFGAATTLSFGLGTGGLNFGAGTNTSASTGLTFGAPTTTTAPLGLGGFSANPTPSLGFGAFGATSTASTTSSFFGPKLGLTTVTGTLPPTSVTPSLGLGGAPPSSGTTGAAANADSKNEPPKQQKLPNEILTTVESFKEFVKKQKALSSEVMRVSVKPLHTVSREAEVTLREAAALAGETARGRAASRRQRAAAAAALAAADAAARDTNIPGTELEGTAPPGYVKDLIAELEQQLITFRRQMDIADKQMQSSPKLLTEQELNLGFRRMHESLVALAGRLQTVHTQVEAQKEQYLNLRKYILKDPTDVFDTINSTSTLDQILKEVDGGRKKTKTGLLDSFGSSYSSDQRTSVNPNNLAGPSPFGYVSGLSPFPMAENNNAPSWQPTATPTPAAASTSTSASFAPQTSSFQLQKPPGKRGKQ